MFNIIILGITSLLTDISTEMVYPLLSVYLVTVLGAGPALLGVVEGIAESTASLLKVFSGYFSDKLTRRKPFTIAGYAFSTIGKVFLYVSASWGMVLAGRVVDRFGKGIRTAPRDALIAESAREKRTGAAFGLHRAMDTLGACIGVAAAYFLITRYHDGIKAIFLWSLVPAVLGVLFLFMVRERAPDSSQQRPKPVFRWSSLDRDLRRFLVFSFLFTLGNSSNQFLLLRAKDLGSPLPQVILMYLVYNLVYGAFSYPAARLSDKIGRKHLLVAGYAVYGLTYLGVALTHSVAWMWALFAVYGLYIAFTEGVEKALVAELAPQPLRATVIGTHAMLTGIGLLPASLLAGFLWKWLGPAAPFYFGGALGIISSIGIGYILRRSTT